MSPSPQGYFVTLSMEQQDGKRVTCQYAYEVHYDDDKEEHYYIDLWDQKHYIPNKYKYMITYEKPNQLGKSYTF